MALDRQHLASDQGQDCGLVARAGADLEDTHPRVWLQQLGHEPDHVRLTDRLARGDRQSAVAVGVAGEVRRQEQFARQLAHRGQDALVANATAAELALDHLRAQ